MRLHFFCMLFSFSDMTYNEMVNLISLVLLFFSCRYIRNLLLNPPAYEIASKIQGSAWIAKHYLLLVLRWLDVTQLFHWYQQFAVSIFFLFFSVCMHYFSSFDCYLWMCPLNVLISELFFLLIISLGHAFLCCWVGWGQESGIYVHAWICSSFWLLFMGESVLQTLLFSGLFFLLISSLGYAFLCCQVGGVGTVVREGILVLNFL